MKSAPAHCFVPVLAFAFCAMFGAGCASTPDRRIAADRELFESWPQAVQERVAVGEVELGFTQPQVRMALGDPARVTRRVTTDGESAVWIYEKKSSPVGLSIGLGVGTAVGRNSSVGGGVTLGSRRARYGEAVRIVFDGGGHVDSIERSGS